MELLNKLKSFGLECWRVLRVTKKPSAAEFKTTLKITGIGILVIGLIGFIIQMINLIFLK